MKLVHSDSWCGKGSHPDQFQRHLMSIAVDTTNQLFVLGDQEVKRFSPAGELQFRFAINVSARSIAVTDEGIWLADHGGIEQYNHQGVRVGRVDDPQRLGRVTGLASADHMLFVADATNRKVHQYLDGAWEREIGGGTNTRGFMLPNGVLDLAWDPSTRSLAIAHPQKHRVELYDELGVLRHKFGRFGMESPADFGGCCNPTNIAVGAGGIVAVSEKAPPYVKVYTATGEFLARSPDGHFDENAKNIDLAIDSHNRIYATDARRCTIELFQLTEDE